MVRVGLLVALGLVVGPPGAATTGPLDTARALYQAGRFEAALERYRAYAETAAVADPAGAATARNNACLILIDLGDSRQALPECEAAVALRRQLDDASRLARSLNNLGLALQRLGRFAEARERFDEALVLNRRLQDAEAEVINLSNLGTLATVAGDYGAALSLHAAAAAAAGEHAGERWAAEQSQVARINQGVVLEKLGAYEEALSLYLPLLAEEREMDRRRRAELHANLGVVYRNLGDPLRAIDEFRQALRAFESLGDSSGLSNARLNLALARHLNLGQLDLAEDAYREALFFAEASGDRNEELQDLFYLGRLLLERGRIDEAESLFSRCLQTADRAGSAEGRWSALEGLGRIARERGDLSVAVDLFEQAMAEIERVRATLARFPAHAGTFGDKRPIYAAAVATLAELDRREPERGHGERAFAVVQRAKARALLDALGSGARPLPPMEVGEFARRLGEEPILEYFVGEGRIFLWVVRGTDLRMFDLGAADPLFAAVTRVHRALARGREPDPALVADLSARLLGPLGVLPTGITRLRIAPDGRLHYLPFEILAGPGAGGDRLIDRYSLSYLPSASALGRLAIHRPRAALTLAGFGNPTLPAPSAPALQLSDLLVSRFRLRPLPASEGELETIGRRLGGRHRTWLGGFANEGAFRRAVAAGARVVHLATHTVVDERPAGGAAILLAPTDDDDGLLYPQEIAALDYRTDLTVLSSCRTAMGAADAGHAMSSLTGALLGAGSSAVVATLWDVGDAATAVFMEQFYDQLGRGLEPAEALRRAKLRLLADPVWGRPGLWAAYVLIGEAPPVVERALVPSWSWALAALLVAAGFASEVRRRRRAARGLSGRSPSPPPS